MRHMDDVFKALADPVRRRLLDRLNAADGQTLKDLCAGMGMARQSVTKHLAVLEAANLVSSVRRGREKFHYLNPVPINEVAERWVRRYDRGKLEALADLKRTLEEPTMEKPRFVYVTYISTTPEQLWEALTNPDFTERYWGERPVSDWKVGSPIHWERAEGESDNWGDEVLEADPPRRLAYRWHSYQARHADLFGWTEARLAELQTEPRSKVSFEIEPMGDVVKLTVTHDGFDTETEMLKAVSNGWPAILSKLKTMLETGEVPDLFRGAPVGDRA
jgi:uncharacterized protein YndB with AHSA1/START domain/DNA-binding transcriptional ArsR family regulator